MKPTLVRDGKEGARLTVYVQPKSAQTQCVGRYSDALKIRVAAPPVDGAANDELIRFLAGELSIPPSAIHIESGVARRHKRLLLKGVRAQQIETYLMRNGW
ncbi:MAG TPA: DUF167 domain-containing protein [Nitrospira sp.]|nr:DUF167 domain-containing protein [Nitrospira sp.]